MNFFLNKKVGILGLSRTGISSIKFLKKTNPKLRIFFIMGADNLIQFHKWNKWKEIAKLAKILVFDRKGYKSKSIS